MVCCVWRSDRSEQDQEQVCEVQSAIFLGHVVEAAKLESSVYHVHSFKGP